MSNEDPGKGPAVSGDRSASVPTVSGLEIRVAVKELSSLVGSYVSNIHGLGESQILRLKKSAGLEGEGTGSESDLVLSPKYGAWLTTTPGYTVTAQFTTSLRGELLRRKLVSVAQQDLDRVMRFRFSGKEDERELILELIPPGNIVLTEGGGRVILALRESHRGARQTVKGRLYAPPPQTRSSPDQVTEESLVATFAKEKTAGRALGRGISLPRKYVDEILARVSLAQDQPSSEVTPQKAQEIVSAVREIIAGLDTPSPSLVRRNGEVELISVAPGPGGDVLERSATLGELMDRVFTPLLLNREETSKVEGVSEDQRARELEVTIKRLREQMEELTAGASELRTLAAQVKAASSKEEIEELLAKLKVEVETRDRTQENQSSASVSSRLYDGAKRNEAEVLRIREAERQMVSRLAKEKGRNALTESKVRVVARGKRDWYEKFRWFYTTEGKLAIGGRDAQSNSILLKRYADDRDVVYHADLFGSPFFILKGGNGAQTPAEVRQVGQATAAFSSAWKTGLGSADSYWVDPGQVSASAPSGEYLAKGSFSIRGAKNFVTRNPVEVSVGVDASGRVVSGPEEAIMKLSRAHVTLVPHREKASDTAKKVLFELKKYFPQELAGASVDDVLRALPAGGGKVVRKRDNSKGDDSRKSVQGAESLEASDQR
ncbi:MAG: NFACT family protein [Thaumarchaeota archaeon]|nr:NFACT family protein [Nitrososphaerota archaeon]